MKLSRVWKTLLSTAAGALFSVAIVLTPNVSWAQCVGDEPDGRVAPNEACDDSNMEADDGCSPMCTIEEDWSCARTLDFRALTNQDYE
ncbi:MAG: hypothetical protein AAFQ65_11645, partial [Myxococcota bacterium]